MAFRPWLFMVASAVGLIAMRLAVDSPRSLRHRPFFERMGLHAFLFGFGIYQSVLEFLSDHFGYDFYLMLRPVMNSLVAQDQHDPRVKIEDLEFSGVRVRMYTPNNRSFNSRALLYFHGGGWSMLHIEHYDGVCQAFALELAAVVVSVEFRLLPENPYPAPLDDCYLALRYLMLNARQWDIDPTRIAVAGDSAGGHIAAALSIRWRREVLEKQQRAAGAGGKDASEGEGPLPPILAQVLVYPVLQLVNTTTSSHLVNLDPIYRRRNSARLVRLLAFPGRQQDGALLDAISAGNHTTRATRERLAPYFHFGPVDGSEDEASFLITLVVNTILLKSVDMLVTNEQRELAARIREAGEHPEGDPKLEAELLPRLLELEVSPLFIDSFDNVPNTYVVTADFDVLRDDSLLFVRRLRASGRVQVAHKHYPLYAHGFMNMAVPGVVQRDFAAFLQKNPHFF